ncbi:hypothetical protein CEK62_19950 (plasmid) [Alcanivorax sp. N3-2A]|nr:hypothetical protein CEK62_01770 [Alcanivorax sp. N3-2A]ASK36645.1 hypothetical protein CEK62_19950 [Alcanivorax sp. N3-2A]
MVDYIRSEEEQAEVLKEWWSKNGVAVVVVVVLAVGGLIGWREWKAHNSDLAAEASRSYETLMTELQSGNTDKARGTAETLVKDYESTSYADYSHLVLAKLAVDGGDFNSAAEQLKAVVNDPATAELEYTARLRLARVQIQQGDLDAAEKQISRSFPNAWQGQALELKGDIAGAREKWDAARDAYSGALETLDSGAERDRVQMKLDDLKRAS